MRQRAAGVAFCCALECSSGFVLAPAPAEQMTEDHLAGKRSRVGKARDQFLGAAVLDGRLPQSLHGDAFDRICLQHLPVARRDTGIERLRPAKGGRQCDNRERASEKHGRKQ